MGQCVSSISRKEARRQTPENTREKIIFEGLPHKEIRQDYLTQPERYTAAGNPPDLVPQQHSQVKAPENSPVIKAETVTVASPPFDNRKRQEISSTSCSFGSQEVDMATERKRSSSESQAKLTTSQLMTTTDYQDAEEKFKIMTESLNSNISNLDKHGNESDATGNQSSGEGARAFKNLMPRNNSEVDNASHMPIIGSDMLDKVERLNSEQRRDTYNKLCEDWKGEIEGTLTEADEAKLLCGVFVVTYEREEVLYQKAIGNIASVLLNPFKNEFKEFPKNYQEEFGKLPHRLRSEVLVWIREKMHEPDVWGDENELIDTLAEQKYIEADEKNDLKSNAIFKGFLERVANLCRDMLTQNPQWHFKREKLMQKWKEEFRSFVTPMETSNESGKNACIKYYHQPVLYAGYEVIEKGVAYVDVWKKMTRK